MQPPLALLGRHPGAVLIQKSAGPSPSLSGFLGPRRVFYSAQDAESYLSHWLGDAGAMGRLRQLLQDVGHTRAVAQCSDREVVTALAAQLTGGTLSAWEQEMQGAYLNVRAAFAAAEAKARAGATVARQDVLVPEPPAPPAPPQVPAAELLPLLENVQIQGAEVLPEIEQTLEQVGESLGQVDLASASIQPAPAAVPPITEAIKEASDSVKQSLDEL